jgi:hypothetical protein
MERPRQKQVKVPEDVVFERVGDEMVLLELEKGAYYGLNPGGARMWELLAESGDPDVVLQRICLEYDVSSDVARQDLDRLLQELLENKLITVDEPFPSAPE